MSNKTSPFAGERVSQAGTGFVVLQAPDVALSQLAVGTVVVPLMIVLTIAKTRRGPR